jgi:vacuolar-type H+-ATPase subunit F/Vma7
VKQKLVKVMEKMVSDRNNGNRVLCITDDDIKLMQSPVSAQIMVKILKLITVIPLLSL